MLALDINAAAPATMGVVIDVPFIVLLVKDMKKLCSSLSVDACWNSSCLFCTFSAGHCKTSIHTQSDDDSTKDNIDLHPSSRAATPNWLVYVGKSGLVIKYKYNILFMNLWQHICETSRR